MDPTGTAQGGRGAAGHEARLPAPAPGFDPAALAARYRQARARRSRWESLWQECYEFTLPQRGDFTGAGSGGARPSDRLFDGTAPDSVEQLAASLLAQLTPPWSRWIGLAPGPELTPAERAAATPILERMAETLHAHLDRSNFAVEIHQCYLDLVVGGTGCLLVEEAGPGALSALRFTAVPLSEAVLEEGGGGRLDVTFRRVEMTLAELDHRFPGAALPDRLRRDAAADPAYRLGVLEAVVPEPPRLGAAYRYAVLLDAAGEEERVLAAGRFQDSPFINFRWLKAPGEAYGRSPVMKALPDIKTANIDVAGFPVFPRPFLSLITTLCQKAFCPIIDLEVTLENTGIFILGLPRGFRISGGRGLRCHA